VADIHAALTYYHDNRKFLEHQNQRAQELVDELRDRYPSKIKSGRQMDARDDSVSS
jgi:response regulator of citrate/malate metabolism